MCIFLFYVVQTYCRVNNTNMPSFPFVNNRVSFLFSSGPVSFIHVLKEIIWRSCLPQTHKISIAAISVLCFYSKIFICPSNKVRKI